MRVAIAVPEIPFPPHKGTALRNYHLIRALAARHEVRILAAGDAPPAARAHLAGLGCAVESFPLRPRRPVDRLRDLACSSRPDLARRLDPAGLADRVRGLANSGACDAVQVEGLELSPLVDAVRAADRPVPTVFDAHNLEYRLQSRAAAADLGRPARWPWAAYSVVQSLKLRRYEARVACRADRVVAVSDEDARGLAALAGRSVTVVPNGIDCELFSPCPADAVREPGPPRLVFCGTLDYRPNVDAAVWLVREILPRVWAVRPDVHLALVGRGPAPDVRALASDRVTVTGYLPDIRPAIWSSDLYVVPLRAGGGTRFKVLEGLALGVPVLTTTLGAEGIGGRAGEHYLVADGAAAFAAAILRALEPWPGRADLVRRGRALVLTRYDWSVVTPRLLDLYDAARPATAARP